MLGLRLVSRTVVRTGSRSMSSLAAVDQVMAAPKIEAGQRAFQENGHLHGADNPVRLQVCYFFAHCTRTCLSPPPSHTHAHTPYRRTSRWATDGARSGSALASVPCPLE